MLRSLPTFASAFVLSCPIVAASAVLSLPVPARTEAASAATRVALPPLTLGARASLLVQGTTDPIAWLAPALDAAFSMAHPPRRQPAAWSVGASGFAHLYAGYLARQSAATAAQSAVAALLREDTRYQPSTERSPLRRAWHAASFTLLDRRGSGRRMVAVSSLAAAVTAAALANAWVAPQFQNSANLTQRTLTSLAALAAASMAAEFHPEAMREARRVTSFPRSVARRLTARRARERGWVAGR